MSLVSSFLELLQQLSFVMTVPTFSSFQYIVTGWVFARRRTVTSMILAANAVGRKHHSSFHRLFAAAQWSLDDLGLAVFGRITRWLEDAPIMLAIDDTLARKRGLKVYGVGMHHDPLLSTRKTALMNWGHNWVVLGVILKFPFCRDRYFCLPILFRLYLNKKTASRKGKGYRTRPELAVEMLHILCDRLRMLRFHVVADSTYGGKSVLLNLPSNCEMTSRLGLNARLYEEPPRRQPGRHGRPRKRGPRLPTPRKMLGERCRHLTLNIYGRRDRSRVADRVARLHAVPDRSVRVVAVEPVRGGRRMQAFYSTCHQASVKDILTWYAMRWSIEEAFQHAKGQLGFEEPQGWTRRAVERTAPTAMLLYSLIVLWFAGEGHRHYRAPLRPWYRRKARASFADMLATLRRASIKEQVSSLALSERGDKKAISALMHAIQQAA
jgi:hypothetical protein